MQGRLDALVFTGGIGENSALVRKLTLEKLALLNLSVDEEQNQQLSSAAVSRISPAESCAVLVIKTNEELVIAQDAARLIA
jgi:acetate kinase